MVSCLFRSFLIFCAAAFAWGQEQVGTLLYRTPTGRGITLVILDAGPGMATLDSEKGDAEKFKVFVQRHCKRESSLDRSAEILKEPPPSSYLSAYGGGPLVKTITMTFWCYGPDSVLPVRFKCMDQYWELIQANVPARIIKQDMSRKL